MRIKKKFRLQSGRTPLTERGVMSRSSPPSNHSISTSSTDSDSIEKGKGTRAKARANDESITGAGGTSRTTTSTGVEKSKSKAKRQRSEVWDHFHKFITDSGENKARCNYCERELFADTKLNGTSSLKSHLKSCSKFPRTSSDPAQTELFCQVTEEGSSISFGKYSAEALRRGIAEMIIEDELPFKFVEAKGFRKCMFIACPRFKMPSRWTIARDCYDIYLDEKKNLNSLLHSHSVRVSLTTDTWTSLQRVNYMCLTCHFIDHDWKLHKRIINFCPITSHKGEDVGKAIEKCLRDWGIDNVYTVTVDNASSNDVAVGYLKRKLNNLGTSILQGKYLHMRCIAHIINIIVTDGMKDMNESIAKVRGAIRYVRQSPSRLLKFKGCVELEKIQSKALLRLDVSTRWNSTYLMLDSAQKFERAFERFEEADPNYKHDLLFGDGVPNHEDWESVRKLSMFLQQFYDLTVKISGSLYVTANVYLDEVCDVYSTLREWLKSTDSEFSSMAKRMVEKYDKYWGNVEKMNMLLYIACVLDPRYKYTFVDFCFKKMYPADQLKDQASILSVKVRSAMVELFEEYRKMHQPQSSQPQSSQSVTDDISQRKGKEKRNKSDFKKYKVEMGCGEQKSELDRYLNEELDNDEDDDDFDILAWWKKNSHRFPILSAMARDILAMPISTVASESAFSTSGRVLDAYRSSLTPKIVQALICAQDWIRQGARMDDMENEIAEMDKFDLDLSKLSLDGVIDS